MRALYNNNNNNNAKSDLATPTCRAKSDLATPTWRLRLGACAACALALAPARADDSPSADSGLGGSFVGCWGSLRALPLHLLVSVRPFVDAPSSLHCAGERHRLQRGHGLGGRRPRADAWRLDALLDAHRSRGQGPRHPVRAPAAECSLPCGDEAAAPAAAPYGGRVLEAAPRAVCSFVGRLGCVGCDGPPMRRLALGRPGEPAVARAEACVWRRRVGRHSASSSRPTHRASAAAGATAARASPSTLSRYEGCTQMCAVLLLQKFSATRRSMETE